MRRVLIAIPVLLAAAALVWGTSQRQASGVVRNALEASYQRDFYNLLDQAEQLQAALGKAAAAVTPAQQTALLTEVWFRSGAALDALAQLPVARADLTATRKFFTQMGDYARTLARRTAEGERLGPEEIDRLGRMEDETARVSSRLHGLRARLTPPRFRWTDALVRGGAGPRRARPQDQPRSADMQAFTDVDERLRRLPGLMYDGPYSDHLEEVKPRGLTGSAIDSRRAVEVARGFADLPGGTVRAEGQPRPVTGRIPAFSVTLRGGRGQRVIVDVSRQGGHVVQMLNSRPLGDARLGEDEALARAREFLSRRGYRDMVPTHALTEGNARIIAFAGRVDRVLVYPDQVKVKVALDDGQVVGFDATQYLTYHRERRLPEPRLTPEDARARVAGNLAVDSVRLAVIPLAGGREVLAYEVRAGRKDTTYLVYINALTGEEENVLKAVPTPSGRLYM